MKAAYLLERRQTYSTIAEFVVVTVAFDDATQSNHEAVPEPVELTFQLDTQ